MEAHPQRRTRTSRSRTAAKKPAAKKKTTEAAKARGKGQAAKDPEAEMMAQWQKSMTPGKGHARLEPMVGKFDVTVKMWMQPGAPPSESGGQSVHKWVLGGRYLQQVYKGKAMGMPFQGIGYTGFDNVSGKYVGSWMDTMGTGIMVSQGIGKPTARKIEFASTMTDPMVGQEVEMRSVIRIKDKDSHSFEMFAKGPDGAEFRTMHIGYKRKA